MSEATTTMTYENNQDFWKWWKEKQDSTTLQPYNPYPQPCPGCGRCPVCGRGASPNYWPPYITWST